MKRMLKFLMAAALLMGAATVTQSEPVEAQTRPLWISWYPSMGGGGYCMFSYCNPAGIICCRIVNVRQE